MSELRKRATWRWIMHVSGASLAVIAVGLGAKLPAYAARSEPSAVGGIKAPAGPPKYYVAQRYSHRSGFKIVVRVRTTGKVVSVVRDPRPSANCGNSLATAGTHTFFMTCQVWRKEPVAVLLYRFEVTNSGRATTPVPVKGGTLGGGLFGDNLAASPDGSLVAIEVTRPNPNGNLYTNEVAAGIYVINTETGKRVFWRTGRYVPGRLGFDGASDISFTQNGSELVLLEKLCHRTRYQRNCLPSDPTEVRAFGPADRSGSLQGGKILLRLSAFKKPGTSIFDALITPDGTALNSVIANCPKRGLCTLTVARIALTNGKVLNKLYQVRTGTRFEGIDMRNFGSDPTGRFLILNAADSPTSKWVNGWIDHGRLVRLTPVDFSGQEVW